MVVLAFLSDPHVVRRILDHLKLPSTLPPVEPARRPQDVFDIVAADDQGFQDADAWPDHDGFQAHRAAGAGPARAPP
ncbi:MAG: hypothetical protein ACUVRE_10125 [Thermoanaerobaculaceae bacterium]